MKKFCALALATTLALGFVTPASAAADTTPPTLETVEVGTSSIYPGGKVVVSAFGYDDSGMDKIQVTFQNVETKAVLSVNLMENTGQFENAQLYAAELKIPTDADPGQYKLVRVLLFDKDENYATYSVDFKEETETKFILEEEVAFTLVPPGTKATFGSCEATVNGNNVHVRLTASAGSGIDNVSVLFQNRDSGRKFTLTMNEDDLRDGAFSRSYIMSEHEPHGVFELRQVVIKDKSGRKVTYSLDPDEDDEDSFLLSTNAAFRMRETGVDTTPPALASLQVGTVKEDKYKDRYLVPLTVRASDSGSGVDYITVTFKNAATGEKASKVLRASRDYVDGVYKAELRMDMDNDRGRWELESVLVRDHAGNKMTWYRDKEIKEDDTDKALLSFTASFTL